MTSTARQLRQPSTIEAIERVPYFADVGISLSGLAELLIALTAIYKVSSLFISSSSKEIILYIRRNSA